MAIEFDHFRFLEIEGGVVVAEHGGHRRDPLQLEDQPRQSDVAGVQDMVDAREELRNLRIEVSVRVGDRADFHVWSVVSCWWSVVKSGEFAPQLRSNNARFHC